MRMVAESTASERGEHDVSFPCSKMTQGCCGNASKLSPVSGIATPPLHPIAMVATMPEPISVRDFPLGCHPQGTSSLPVHTFVASRSPSSSPLLGRGGGRNPHALAAACRPSVGVVWNFEAHPSDAPEDLYYKRRKRFAALLRYFQQLHELGELPGRARPDLEAAKKMAQDKQVSNWKGVGHVPGSMVGDFFYYRSELCVLGLHRATQAGIAFATVGDDKLGCSVVASGGYEDDQDHGETFLYCGHGGNHKRSKRQVRDQVAEGGNLALQNSCRAAQPVRVIRGHSDIARIQSPSRRLYSYDGLYNVVREGSILGTAGFRVFQFKLQRVPHQTELGSRLVSFVGRLNKAPEERAGLIAEDLSGGKEPIPVCVVNTVDGDGPPDTFEYVTASRYPATIALPSRPSSQCACAPSRPCHTLGHECACVLKNAGRVLPYNQCGLLIRALPAVFECGSHCHCALDCSNRVCQRGLRYRLEVFKTESKGWGVRSWDFIPSGGFVCEYTGEVMDSETADELDDDEYLFNLDVKQGNEARWGDQADHMLHCGDAADNKPKFVIDACRVGGVARFINHSCKPNLFVQCVLYDACNLDIPRVMLFAGREIHPFQELTYDYGYALDSVFDADGNPKKKMCRCDARGCRKRMY